MGKLDEPAAVRGDALLVASQGRDFAHNCQQLSSRSRSW